MASPRRLVCPWCGHAGPPGAACVACGGGFDDETRRVTRNDMGPWFVRDPRRPFQPGCSYEALAARIDRGDVGPTTILRGPTTRQLWAAARRVPAVAHLLGYCHACDAKCDVGADRCPACAARFGPWLERDRLGLAPVQLTPDEVPSPDDAREPADGAGAAALAVISTRRTAVSVDSPPAPATDTEAARLADLAERFDTDGSERRGSGAWTAMIAALLIVLAGLILLPMMPGLIESVRDRSEPETERRDLPGGVFRSRPADAEPAAIMGPVDAGDSTNESVTTAVVVSPDAAATVPITRADSATEPASASAPAPAPAPGSVTPAPSESLSVVDLRRLRRLADDAAGDPRGRLGAWREFARRRAGAIERGETLPDDLAAAGVEEGIDRVHLDAFLRGWSPSDVRLMVGVDPAEAAESSPRAEPVRAPGDRPSIPDVRFFSNDPMSGDDSE